MSENPTPSPLRVSTPSPHLPEYQVSKFMRSPERLLQNSLSSSFSDLAFIPSSPGKKVDSSARDWGARKREAEINIARKMRLMVLEMGRIVNKNYTRHG